MVSETKFILLKLEQVIVRTSWLTHGIYSLSSAMGDGADGVQLVRDVKSRDGEKVGLWVPKFTQPSRLFL